MNQFAPVTLRPAMQADARTIARLIAVAGEGVPTWYWSQSAAPDEDPIDVGAARAARHDANLSYRNAVLAERAGQVAGMVLGYRLHNPTPAERAKLASLPDLLRPLVELEHEVPGSFYVNALAVFESFRDAGIGTRLLQAAAGRATALGCTRLAIQVFSQNIGAIRLYERNGYRPVASRPIVPHPCYPYSDRVLLMVRSL